MIEVMILLGGFAVHLGTSVRPFVLTDDVEVAILASAAIDLPYIGQC